MKEATIGSHSPAKATSSQLRVGVLALILGLLCGYVDPDLFAISRSKDPVAVPTMEEQKPRRFIVESQSRRMNLEALMAMGYIEGTSDTQNTADGVVIHEKDKSYAGYNLYYSWTDYGASLIDMEGSTVHSWSGKFGPWQHVELLPGGELLIIVADEMLVKIDRNSKLLWKYQVRAHHDLWVGPDDNIYLLTRSPSRIPTVTNAVDTLEDKITILDHEGRLKEEISILELFENSPYAFLLPSVDGIYVEDGQKAPEDDLDILHTNHVEVFDGHLAALNPLFARNNILISVRNINTIAIIDGATRKILWIWGPTNLNFQHHPRLLENGNILVFDNGTENSRILELDMVTKKIEWLYDPGDSQFFTSGRGSNQRLPNGNTLITESNKGIAFELSPTGRIVWQFNNPKKNEEKQRVAIWRVTRFEEDDLRFLKKMTDEF
jgi:hypothetical protein